ncbi:AAA family ATPase [Gorillibacterium timonense]|uniref:AAA family ATPase n=1 Tax=Gorillibacterium timonense TaxID=1689269 RepID=UPI00071C3301|nr:AAA family ATPase [Gorillibacterium timonense]
MIIWINRAFGSGKTQTAYELKRRLPGSMVYDPEVAGYFLQKMIPKQAAEEDFQDYPMWREVTYSTLSYLNRSFKGVILVPMTLTEPLYFWETVGRLRKEGAEVHHVTLLASRETLQKRLKNRGDGAKSWPAHQIDRCIEALGSDLFADHLETDLLTLEETAEAIATRLQLRLKTDERGAIRKRIGRWLVQLRHIRV